MTGSWNTGNRNTGDRNTGTQNAGSWNTGDLNTGDWNTGNWNTGDRNTGNWNTGGWNTGHRNTGHRNTGHRNTGGWNTGGWNTGNRNVGSFNTVDQEEALFFNEWCPISEWNKAKKPKFIYQPSPTTFIDEGDMSEEEKADNPTYKTTGGYLRINDMAEEWRRAYEAASEEDIQLCRDLPNFDYDVFEEITGLDIRPKCTEKTVTIDGIEYFLVRM